MEVQLSPVRTTVSSSVKGGFPFVIHIPMFFVEHLEPNIKDLIRKCRYKTQQPCFLRTDLTYIRIQPNYGDALTATTIWQAVSEIEKSLCFKNWID